MSTHGRIATLIGFLTLFLVSSGLAGTGEIRDRKCPVCEESLSVTVLFSSNNAGGADPDLMRRAGGAFPLIVEPILCSKCHFATWSVSSLDEPVPEKLKTALLAQESPFVVPEFVPIVPSGPLRGPYTEGLDSKQTSPAWVRYDLLAQQFSFTGESAWLRYQAAHNAAWAVRLRENPLQEFLFDMTREQFTEALKGIDSKKERDNPAADQIDAARKILKNDALTKDQAVVAGFLLRTHGELTDLEEAWPRIVKAIGEEHLTSKVQKSIALERVYLGKALACVEELLLDPPEQVQPGVLHYLKGEFHRRLNQPAEAREAYAKALEGELPDWLKDWAKGQPELLSVVKPGPPE